MACPHVPDTRDNQNHNLHIAADFLSLFKMHDVTKNGEGKAYVIVN